MEVICEQQVAAWQEKLQDIRREEVQRAAEWKLRQAELESRSDEVLALYDEKIAAAQVLAKAVANTAEPSAKAKPSVMVKPPKPESTEEKDAIEAFRQLKVTPPMPIVKGDLNVLVAPPPKETIGTLTSMHHWFCASAFADALLPYTFADIGATVVIAHSLIGDKVWEAFFGLRSSSVVDTDVVPMQLRGILLQQLNTYRTTISKENAEAERTAQESLEVAGPRLAKLKQLVDSGSHY